jgi:hypothetical protein
MEYIRSIRMVIEVDTNKQTTKLDQQFENFEDMVEAAETFADDFSRWSM